MNRVADRSSRRAARAGLVGLFALFPFNTTIIDYGSGAVVGSTFTAKFVGLVGHVPGYIASDAGQGIVTGFVRGFEENGSPLLVDTELVLQHGNFESGDDIDAAICAALTV